MNLTDDEEKKKTKKYGSSLTKKKNAKHFSLKYFRRNFPLRVVWSRNSSFSFSPHSQKNFIAYDFYQMICISNIKWKWKLNVMWLLVFLLRCSFIDKNILWVFSPLTLQHHQRCSCCLAQCKEEKNSSKNVHSWCKLDVLIDCHKIMMQSVDRSDFASFLA